MDTKKKIRLTARQKNNIGVLVVAAIWATAGFMAGQVVQLKLCNNNLNECLKLLFEKDPTLKQHFVDTVVKVQGEKLMEGL